MPEKESPSWSGLPNNIEILFKIQDAQKMIQGLWELNDIEDDG